MQIEQEKFDSLKELAGIQSSISEGRAVLYTLKNETEAYMLSREVEVRERVARVLKESAEALQKISTNHQELTAYRSELQAYATEIKGFSSTLRTLFQDFDADVKQADADMVEHRAGIAKMLRELKVAQVNVDEDRKQLARERQETNEGMKRLASDRAALQAAWDQLNRNK